MGRGEVFEEGGADGFEVGGFERGGAGGGGGGAGFGGEGEEVGEDFGVGEGCGLGFEDL